MAIIPAGTMERSGMLNFDAFGAARRQLERDRASTARYPDLFAHKLQRMRASPLAYLRGSAPLFYEVLSKSSELERGPQGSGWLAGDLHLENFGAA